MNCSEDIIYKGFSLRISFDYDKGFKGSQLEPPEPELIEIEKVVLLHKLDFHAPMCPSEIEIDITDLLHDKQFLEIETILWEKKEDRYDR